MRNKQYWIDKLQLTEHIEGGYFKEVLRSNEKYLSRSLYTSIYFLLDENNCSNFHRLTADEVWYFHEGNSLTIHMIHEDGKYETVKLGKNIEKGEVLQYVVKKNIIFGSTVDENYALVSCMVAPGFEYEDFKLFTRNELLSMYPQHQNIIHLLTKGTN